MLDAARLYGAYVSVQLRSQLQYRASFLLDVTGTLLVSVVEFIGIWALFDRFGRLQDWTLPEVALFYGVANVAFALADGLGRGFEAFGDGVRTGDFDRVLLRPRSTALQVAGADLNSRLVGRLGQGLGVMLWALARLETEVAPADVALLAAAVAGGALLFIGLQVLRATLAFWTTETLEITHVVTYGGAEASQYPMPIYEAPLRRFFTFVVPLACVAYLPVVAVLDRPDPLGSPEWAQWAAPLAGPAFLVLCLRVWRLGVRRYTSTGT